MLSSQEWEVEILKNLTNVDIILLLINSDFLASEYVLIFERRRAMKIKNITLATKNIIALLAFVLY